MKKIFYLMLAVACFTLASCSKDEPGGTATQAQAGEWYGYFTECDANGNIADGTPSSGPYKVYSYNTAENSSNKMYINDMGNFWQFQVEVTVDPSTNTFQTAGGAYANNLTYECGVMIKNGKITPNGGVQKNGSVADACEFIVSFDDDGADPHEYYKFSGVRYSGLTEND